MNGSVSVFIQPSGSGRPPWNWVGDRVQPPCVRRSGATPSRRANARINGSVRPISSAARASPRNLHRREYQATTAPAGMPSGTNSASETTGTTTPESPVSFAPSRSTA